MSWVWENGPQSQAERFVLIALADFANDAGECWPSMASVARKTCMTERGAQKIIRRLEADGWIRTTTGGGRSACNSYTLSLENPERHTGNETTKPRTTFPEYRSETPNVSAETPNTGALNPEHGSPEPSRTVIEPSVRKNPPIIPPTDFSDEFEAIWKAYPRKVGKGAAAKQWAKARRSHSFEAIARPLAEFCRLREGSDQQFTPHLATWLHQERWNDEQGHAVNRRPNSSEDIERLSRIPADDVDRLFQGIPQLRLIGQ